MSIFDDTDLAAEAAKVKEIKHYEQDVEPLDAPTGPISDSERESLDRATAQTFQSAGGSEIHDRAETFVIPGQWVSPVVLNRRKRALMLQSRKVLNDLDERISNVTRFSGLPDDVTKAASAARLAIGAAREAYESAQSETNPRFAVSVEAKDAVNVLVGKATVAVGNVERLAGDPAAQVVQFEALVGDLDKQRETALQALRAAEKAYAAFRRTVDEAQSVALATGRHDVEFHHGLVEVRELTSPLESIHKAVGWLEGDDDWNSGRFLTAEYDGIPPHTLARLKRGADVSGGSSFAAQVYHRAVNPSADDADAQQAIRNKTLIVLLNSNPWAKSLDPHLDD